MRQLQPVIWSKGTFLSPQHLQAQERFVEDSLRFYLESLGSAGWGFLSVQLDARALTAGSLSLSRASGVFPDALLFDIPGSDAAPEARPLDSCFAPGQLSCTFSLAIPGVPQGRHECFHLHRVQGPWPRVHALCHATADDARRKCRQRARKARAGSEKKTCSC